MPCRNRIPAEADPLLCRYCRNHGGGVPRELT
jgi:hypothetical protein